MIFGVVLIAGLLQIPSIQTKVSKLLTDYISNNTGFRTSISKVQIRWWDAVSLKDVTIYDQKDSLMANLEEVFIDFSIAGIFDKNNPSIDQIKLERGSIRLLTHPEESRINISEFLVRINSLFGSAERDPNRKSVKFSIGNIYLENASLDIINYSATPVTEGFDFNQLNFRNLIADADEFETEAGVIFIKLNYLRGEESNSGMFFQQLKTDFTLAPTYMEFANLYLRSNKTEIKDYLKFSYESIASLSNFTQEVEILTHLDESALDIKDLKYFSNQIPDFEDRIFLSGEIKGTVDDLSSDELLIRFGKKSALFGKFIIDGLPNIDSTFFQMSLLNSVLSSEDLAPYISEEAIREIDKFRDIRFDTDFNGYLNNFMANGNFRTSIGTIIGRLNYKLVRNQPSYNGRVELKNLDLGILMEDPETFQKVSMTGLVKGTGLSLETFMIQVDANIKSAGINQYDFKNITTNATFGKDLFKGRMKVNDPNLKAEIDGVLDLREGKDSIRMMTRIDTAFLREINLMDKEGFVSGNIELDTKGLTLDNIEGIARFSDILLSYEGKNLNIDNFFFQSLFTDESRLISLNSDLLVAGISGNFKVKELAADVERLGRQYIAILTNTTEDPTLLSNAGGSDPYQIDINLNFIDINPIINLFEPSTTISKNTIIEGAFYNNEENIIFNLFTGIDSIYYNGNYLFDTNLDFNTSKMSLNNEVLASFYIFSKKQILKSGLTFNNLAMEAIWDESKIDLSINQDQFASNSYIKLKSEIELFRDHTSIVMLPSELKILEKTWSFEGDNQIYLTDGLVQFENIKLFNEDQFVAINGKITADPEDILSLDIHELKMDFLNTLSLQEYEGTANGLFAFNNFYEKIGVNGNLNIDNLLINNFLIGDIEAGTYLEEDLINLELSNLRDGIKIIEINGSLGRKDEELALKAKLNNANLSVLEPFLSTYLTQMGGTVSGEFAVEGSLNAPVVLGTGRLTGGTTRINYLNTFYTIDGNIVFSPNEISFKELILKDINGNRNRMRGGIVHDGFKNFILDISSNLENFQVLNTSSKDNELFYGTAFVTGTLDIFGAANNLDLNARTTTNPNTRIYIPLGSSSVQAQEDYINIINIRDTTRTISFEESVQKLAINNVRMNFNLDVTPDAYTEIQIDPRTGENIQGRGRGLLNLNIDTQGNFSMSGNYEITEAKYNFSLYNIIKREFIVQPGGRISWFGDPYEGVMDLKAIYQESVSLQNLQAGATGSQLEDPQMRRRWPVKVIMDLKGKILSPDIAFDFDFSGFPEGNIQTYISAFRNRIANDEQEKNRQVFSVIMMRSFSPEGQFSGVSSLATSNLSQLLSSQLNNFIAQVDQNLEVDIDLATLDQSALETFQLRVAYTFLEGRLRVMRDGGFTDLQGNADLNSIAGDWQAEYLLTEDGRYRLRIYNRNNFNTFTSLSLSRNVATYGMSISQNLSFSSFRELFEKIRNRDKDKLRINDTDDFLRYQDGNQLNWTPIPLKELNKRVNVLDRPMDSQNEFIRKEEQD
ncbi:hypothetical protein P872_02420 [Rhodonellum psychrophilum GCM71 = DSM 17998]|uniref:Translocation and assembly module TamB C-terminal domain-containing protein n=2 Tax=Rhodonellum TaxID=336827 RepID=U5C627_9BACT|nr:hypothetical protein P872_02420 [Rhodonellum psychrophilum GCM71 = DSM 17998]SDY90836.1 Family of unknown function [Rhodonellum ikkaensis]